MSKDKNPVWSFFASVKLALFTLFILAVTSIVGTLIPQKESMEFYIEKFGPGTARFFQLLDVPDMYNAWWFLLLLALLSMNLIVCSLERLPRVWRLMTLDNTDTDPGRLRKMGQRRALSTSVPVAETAGKVAEILAAAGWKTRRVEREDGTLLFGQKGTWTRLGVYIVHSSILVIFIGAIIGSLFGFKASVMLPELATTDKVYASTEDRAAIPLGFELRCDRFELTYYDNGAPKDYISDLVVLEDGREVLKKTIEVNDPLHYKGLTFYQSSYNPYNEFLITVQDQNSETRRTFRMQPKRKVLWPEQDIELGILSAQGPNQWGQYRVRVWFTDKKGPASTFDLDSTTTSASVQRPDTAYTIGSKQFFATGLQVAKDPGVWPVYIGCGLMIFGLIVAFFMSHRRLWVHVGREGDRTIILLAGVASKNQVGFEARFDGLVDRLSNNETLQASRE